MRPCKSDTPTFMDNKGQTWGQALWSVGFYLHISDWYKYRATYILLKQT